MPEAEFGYYIIITISITIITIITSSTIITIITSSTMITILTILISFGYSTPCLTLYHGPTS